MMWEDGELGIRGTPCAECGQVRWHGVLVEVSKVCTKCSGIERRPRDPEIQTREDGFFFVNSNGISRYLTWYESWLYRLGFVNPEVLDARDRA